MKKDKVKKNGIFRKAFILPFLFFILILCVFNYFFLDSILKKSFEFTAESFHYAEVNVNQLKTSFFDLSLEINKIEFTDKKKPEFNQFEIGRIKFSCLWDALLRAKLVINIADLGDIKVNTKRSRKGKVFPLEEEDSVTKKTLDNAKEEFDGNIFADISALLGGENLNDIGKNIALDLESEKKFQQLEADLVKKEKEVQSRIKKLPSREEQKDFEKRLSKIKWKDLGNLLKAPGVIQQASRLKKDVEKAKKSIDKARKSIVSSVSLIETSYKEANQSVRQDIAKLNKRAKLPTLDTKSISRVLFGRDLVTEIEKYKGYFDSAKKYIPKKKNKIAAPVKKERGKGRVYHFGTPKSYPSFWLKKLRIKSENNQGVVKGEVLDITTDQVKLGRATTVNLDADFAKEGIRGLELKSVIDFRGTPQMSSNLFIKSYPVIDKKLTDSKDVTFILRQASNQITVESVMTEKDLKLKMKNLIQNIDYETAAKSKQVDLILKQVAKKTPKLTLDARATGKWDDIKFDVKSNLAKAIQNATKTLIQERINKEKNKIKKQVEDRIAVSRNRVQKKIDTFKASYQSQIDQSRAEFDKIKRNVDKEKKSAEKKIRKSGTNFLRGIKL